MDKIVRDISREKFATYLLVKIQDDFLPDRLDPHHSMKELIDIGPFLHRDVVQTLFRFIAQLGKFEVWMKYVSNHTKDQFRPKIFLDDINRLLNIVNDMRRRLDMFKDRGNMSLGQVGMFPNCCVRLADETNR